MRGGHTWKYADPSSEEKYRKTLGSYGSYGFMVPVRNMETLRAGWNQELATNAATLSPDVSWYKHAAAAGKSVYARDPLLVWHEGGYSNTWHTHRDSIDAPKSDSSFNAVHPSSYMDEHATLFGVDVHYRLPHVHWNDYVYGVLSGGTDGVARRQTLRDTWCSGVRCLFVVAGGYADVQSESEAHNDILWLDREETYFAEESVLPFKTGVFYDAMVKHAPMIKAVFKAVVFTDTSTTELEAVLAQGFEYWGYVHRQAKPIRTLSGPSGKWYVSEKLYPRATYPLYASGAGYALSRAFLTCAQTKVKTLAFMPREDVMTGLLAEECNVTPTHSDLVDYKGGKGEGKLVRHRVSREDMMQLVAAHDQLRPATGSVPKDWCKTHDVLPNGAFCTKKYAGMDKTLAPALLKVLGNTIGDFGAGGGWYTFFFNKNGRQSSAYDASPTRGDMVTYMDLTKASELEDVYDSVLCLEVGEHVPNEKSDILLSNLVKHATTSIVLSWAIPGQSGNGHINCQTNQWVVDKMKILGWAFDDERSRMLRNAATFHWFKNTIMCFVPKSY